MNNIVRVLNTAKLYHKCNHFKFLQGIACSNNVFQHKIVRRHYVSKDGGTVFNKEEGFVSKIVNKVLFYTVVRSKLKVAGYMLLQSVVDDIDYASMMSKLNLPDTFYSWFVITELYIWMIMVRYMAEGQSGRQVRNSIIEAFWVDVKHRANKLGAANPAAVRKTISELSHQLNAALVAYDEGLQSSDTILAGALWRRIYQQEDVDPQHLEALVKYIRRQIRLLDNMTHSELFHDRKINWEPFTN